MQTTVDLSLKKLIDSELFDNSALSKKPLEKLFMSFIKDYIPQNDYSFEANEIRRNLRIKKESIQKNFKNLKNN
jgi:hypothetical protein